MTDEENQNDPNNQGPGDSILGMMRRQVAELEEARAEFMRDPMKNPTEYYQRLEKAILQFRVISRQADEIARALEQEKNDDQSEGKTP